MTNEVIVNLNIFGNFVEGFIVSNLNDISIVTVDWSYSRVVNSKIL